MKHRIAAVVLLFALLSQPAQTLAEPSSSIAAAPSGTGHRSEPADAYATAYNYTIIFYPRLFTFCQAAISPLNQLAGPKRISPLFHAAVAVNDDTLYAITFLDLSSEPVIVTVPATSGVYSVLHLDQYGNMFHGIPSGQPGAYGLIGPSWHGELPEGVIPVPMPYDFSELIFRSDKYLATGEDVRPAAAQFRESLHSTPLSSYLNDPAAGSIRIFPELMFAIPYKHMVDHLATDRPHELLKVMQTAVQSPDTQPLTADEQSLSTAFNTLFAEPTQRAPLIAGAQAAYAAILANYQAHAIAGSQWITFNNIAEWDTSPQGYLDRAAITEYIQLANNHSTAVYYHSFTDVDGTPLNGTSQNYILKFAKGKQPEVTRFWSLTGYVPKAIELVPNEATKYAVASYTPGLITDPDGSVTILMSAHRPIAFPEANWLPVPEGEFNIMLRAYGPQGSVLEGSYVPPVVRRVGW